MKKANVKKEEVKELSFTIPGYGVKDTSFMLRTTTERIVLYINGKRVTMAGIEGQVAKDLSAQFEALARDIHQFAYLQDLPKIS